MKKIELGRTYCSPKSFAKSGCGLKDSEIIHWDHGGKGVGSGC